MATLSAKYASKALFDAAVAAYDGGIQIDYEWPQSTVKAGSQPPAKFELNSDDTVTCLDERFTLPAAAGAARVGAAPAGKYGK